MRNIESKEYGKPTPLSLRPAFMHHVVAPLTHLVVSNTLDRAASPFLSDIQHDPISNSGNAARNLEKINHRLFAVSYKCDRTTYWNRLSIDQRLAAQNFTSFGSDGSPDRSIFTASVTIRNIVADVIAPRHPELQLEDPEQLTAFLRRDETPSILRGFTNGGNGFADSFRWINAAEPTKPWRDDPRKPVLDTSNPQAIKTLSEVRQAGISHKKYIEGARFADDTDAWGLGSGLTDPSMIYSDGCPARRLKFVTDEKSLVAANLSLTEAQVEPLLEGTYPVAEQDPMNKHSYSIKRDAFRSLCHLFADATEIVR